MVKKITFIIFILVSLFVGLFMLACNNGNEPFNHTHSYVWNHDTAYHWKECECNDIDEATRTIHQFKYVLNEEYHWQKCECGFVTEKAEHSYDRKGLCVCGSTTDAEMPYTNEDVAGVYYLWEYSWGDGRYVLDKNRTIEIFADGTIEWGLWRDSSITKTYELKGHTIQINYENESDVLGIRDDIICFTYEAGYNYYYEAYLCKEGINPNKEYGDLYYNVGLDGNYCIIGLKNAETRSITIPSVINKVDVTSIGLHAFNQCNNLTEVIIPEGITAIGQDAFNECGGLMDIVIPNSVTSIGREAFYLCSSLESVTIGNGVTEIGDKAFYKCDSLKSISIGRCEIDISYYLFYGSGNLESIIASEDNKRYYVENNCLIERETKTLVLGCKSSVIPDYITDIGDYAFAYSDIESLTIPDSVMSVGNYAFASCKNLRYNGYDNGYYLGNELNPYLVLVKAKDTEITACIVHNDTRIICAYSLSRCRNLESVTIGNNVISIGDNAFQYCESLKSITIPDSVVYLGRDAFWSCSSLESVYIGSGVTDVNLSTIYRTPIDLKSITVSENNKAYYSINNCLIERETNTLILGCKTSIIPDGVTEIGELAFYNCRNLESIVIPDSVTTIGDEAFGFCLSLNSVTIGKGVTTIGYSAFYGCRSLKSIVIPENVTGLRPGAFDSSGLVSIEIRGNITNIEEYTFWFCESLKSIKIPDSVTTIGDEAFYGCYSLESIVIPDSVTTIGDEAFNSCYSLESVYYKGTAKQWNAITIGAYNYSLNAETVYYYSESEPQEAGRYWHYDDDGVTPVIWGKEE